jgi:hypothetical protein
MYNSLASKIILKNKTTYNLGWMEYIFGNAT